jgi:DNA-binding MarR family transcriptional regulator
MEMPGVGNMLRNAAKRLDPSPSETMVSITQEGKDRAAQLQGKSQIGLILNYLVEFSPRSVTEIAHDLEVDVRIVKRNLEAYKEHGWYLVKTR